MAVYCTTPSSGKGRFVSALAMVLGRTLYREKRVLSWDVALQVADVAKVPSHDREGFYDYICGIVQMVWERDRRPSKPGDAFIKAANAARALNAALQVLNKDDREWLQKILAQHPYPDNPLRDLDRTVSVLAYIFDTAIGRAPDAVALPGKKGRKQGGFNDKTFHDFVWNLLLSALAAGGELKLDKNHKKGTLVDALDILRPHLPKGVIPISLPLSTIQKIKTRFSKSPH